MDDLRQAQADGVVRGLKDIGVASRLDVDELLLTLPDIFNLLCLALNELMAGNDSNDVMSYFSIAGIHGLPMALWDGIDANSKHSGGYGYCNHSVPTFPPWHRPYLAMIEQTIFVKMNDIAERFPEASKQTYRQAAQQFRLPYWDYYRPRGQDASFPGIFRGGKTSFKYDFSVPKIFTVSQVMLKTPESSGNLVASPNPLQLFNFPSQGSIPDGDWNILGDEASEFSRKQTQRYPFASSPLKSLNDAINKNRESGVSQILNMISDPGYKDYDAFAHDTAATPSSGSLEGIHGTYHVLIGGEGGHMSQVPIAAFDPMFWLHHCQIDRWFAVWQAVNGYQRFDEDQNDLLPFRKSKADGTFWNSEDVMDTQTFGYVYGDINGNADQVQSSFIANYGWSKRTSRQPIPGPAPSNMQPFDLSKAQVYQYNTTASLAQGVVDKAQKILADPVAVVTSATGTQRFPPALGPDPHMTTAVLAPASDEHAMGGDGGGKRNEHMHDGPVDESKFEREWFVDLVVQRLALNGAFTVYFFIGDTPGMTTATNDYMSYSTLAGVNHVFAAPVEACDNCANQQQQAHLVSNTAPITPILLDYMQTGELTDLSAENVKPFLIKNLKWRVVTVKGDRINPRDVSGLKISVSSKLTAVGDQGEVTYQEFPEISRAIIENAS